MLPIYEERRADDLEQREADEQGRRSADGGERDEPPDAADEGAQPTARNKAPCRSIRGTTHSSTSPRPRPSPPKKRRLLSRIGNRGSVAPAYMGLAAPYASWIAANPTVASPTMAVKTPKPPSADGLVSRPGTAVAPSPERRARFALAPNRPLSSRR